MGAPPSHALTPIHSHCQAHAHAHPHSHYPQTYDEISAEIRQRSPDDVRLRWCSPAFSKKKEWYQNKRKMGEVRILPSLSPRSPRILPAFSPNLNQREMSEVRTATPTPTHHHPPPQPSTSGTNRPIARLPTPPLTPP